MRSARQTSTLGLVALKSFVFVSFISLKGIELNQLKPVFNWTLNKSILIKCRARVLSANESQLLAYRRYKIIFQASL